MRLRKVITPELEEQIRGFATAGMRGCHIARKLRVRPADVYRLKAHMEEKYSSYTIRAVARLAMRGATTKEISFRRAIPEYQVRRIRREYRLPAPNTGARYLSRDTKRALRRRQREDQKKAAADFRLPLRTVKRFYRRER